MLRYEELETVQSGFQKYDWRLQVVLIGWSISVGILILGIRLLTANASLLTIGP
ncbi:MAG: hypothetical protein Q8R78_04165 [Candidatus Omnitrophota bacterium]|nr:hypothetical protein [Candidatus Omnitrophota bacterium]